MAEMEDDYDDDYYYDDDFLYVEDSYALADELAEDQYPPAPAVEYLDEDTVDYDYFDYWMDIEYGTDEYYDAPFAPEQAAKGLAIGQKRKAEEAHAQMDKVKRRKVSAAGSAQPARSGGVVYHGPNVIWLPAEQISELVTTGRPLSGNTFYSIPSDWTKLENTSKEPLSITDAPDSSRAKTVAKSSKKKSKPQRHLPSSEEGAPATATGQADPLVAMLQSKIQDAGLDSGTAAMIQDALAAALQNGGANLDEVLEQITGSLVDRVNDEGKESSVGQWLTRQGVDLDREEEEEEGLGEPAECVLAESNIPAEHTGQTEAHVEEQQNAAERSSTLRDSGTEELGQTAGKTAQADCSTASAGQVNSPDDATLVNGHGEDPVDTKTAIKGKKRKAIDDSEPSGRKPAKASKSNTSRAKGQPQKKAASPPRRSTRSTRSKGS